MKDNHRLTVRLDAKEYKLLSLVSSDQGRSMQNIMHEVLINYIKKFNYLLHSSKKDDTIVS